MEITLYQTLQERGNPEVIENEGPFVCRFKTAWLGKGFYFWDSYIELGHHWGRIIYNSEYIICRANGNLDQTCWDLHGNGIHRLEFEKVCQDLVRRGLAAKKTLTVPQVITYLKNSGKFPFKAIRALAMESMNCKENDPYMLFRVKFKADKKSYLDLRPPVQLCLIDNRYL